MIIPIQDKLEQCRICLEEDTECNLIHPCNCRGTAKYVHRECIDQWREMSINPIARDVCLECNSEYAVEEEKKLFHTHLFDEYSLKRLFLFQYMYFSAACFVYKLISDINISEVYDLFRGFYISMISVYGIELLYCVNVWIFYVRDKCSAFMSLMAIMMFLIPFSYYILAIFYTKPDEKKDSTPIVMNPYIVLDCIMFGFINIIQTWLFNVMYISLQSVRLESPEHIRPCRNRIQ